MKPLPYYLFFNEYIKSHTLLIKSRLIYADFSLVLFIKQDGVCPMCFAPLWLLSGKGFFLAGSWYGLGENLFEIHKINSLTTKFFYLKRKNFNFNIESVSFLLLHKDCHSSLISYFGKTPESLML